MQPQRKIIGFNVGRFRRQRSLSVSALGRRSGVSKATLLAIELGDGNPTIDTLEAVANALDVTIADLVTSTDTHRGIAVQRLADGGWHDYEDFRFRALGTFYGPDLVHVLHGSSNEIGYVSEGHEAGSFECVFALSGVILVGDPDDPVELHPGDSARYAADVPHTLRSVTGTAETILVMQRSELSRNLLPIEKP